MFSANIILRALIHPDFPIVTKEGKQQTAPLSVAAVKQGSTLLAAEWPQLAACLSTERTATGNGRFLLHRAVVLSRGESPPFQPLGLPSSHGLSSSIQNIQSCDELP